MADNQDINDISDENGLNKPLPPQPERIRHLPEWETPLHPPKRRREGPSSIFSRLPAITVPKPAITMPALLKRPVTLTARPKKKPASISKHKISAPFGFSPGTASPAGSLSMLQKDMLMSSPTDSRTLLPTHHVRDNDNPMSSNTFHTASTPPTTSWSPPTTPLQYPHNHDHVHDQQQQIIDEKTSTTTKSRFQTLLLTTLLPKLKLRLPSTLNALLPSKLKSNTTPDPPNTTSSTQDQPPTPPEKDSDAPPHRSPFNLVHRFNNLPPSRRRLLLLTILPLLSLLLLALLLGLSLGLTLRSKHKPSTSTLPLPWSSDPPAPYTGALTFYNPGVGVGACGYANYTDADYVAAVGWELYDAAAKGPEGDEGAAAVGNSNENLLCGRGVRVWLARDGEREGEGVVARVVDRCTGCGAMDLDLSMGAFAALGGGGSLVEEGRVEGRWVWVDT